MAGLDSDGISARLRRLPGQLLLALINATALLVIVAAILALVAIARIEHLAGSVAATMTDAVLSKVDLPQRGVLTNLQNLTAEVRNLGAAIEKIGSGENPLLQSELARLREALTTLRTSVDRLANARAVLTDEAIRQLGQTATDALMRLRNCSPDGPRAGPSRLAPVTGLPALCLASEGACERQVMTAVDESTP